MEHASLTQLERKAEVYRVAPSREGMSRHARLVRWACLLDRYRDRKLTSLHRTEYRTPWELDVMRRDDSPLTVAFRDPILRADGLEDDTYGAAKRYFGLSDEELHRVVCFCFHGEAMSAEAAALRVRSLLPKPTVSDLIRHASQLLERWKARHRRWFGFI